jgi:hypothetical protein
MKFSLSLLGVMGLLLTPLSACSSPRDNMPDAIEIYTDTEVAALAEAACRGDIKQVKRLIAEGVDVNASGIDNTTPLFYAEVCRNLKGVTALLENGADPNARADNGYTPVLMVVQMEDPRLLEVIIEHGGNVNAKNTKNNRETALTRAFAYGAHKDKWQNYHFLLGKGADHNQTYSDDQFFLQYVAGTYARFGEAQRLYELGFEGDLDALINTVEKARHSLLETAKRDREIFLEKLYADRDVRDRALEESSD